MSSNVKTTEDFIIIGIGGNENGENCRMNGLVHGISGGTRI
jgi:hypothetical protein